MRTQSFRKIVQGWFEGWLFKKAQIPSPTKGIFGAKEHLNQSEITLTPKQRLNQCKPVYIDQSIKKQDEREVSQFFTFSPQKQRQPKKQFNQQQSQSKMKRVKSKIQLRGDQSILQSEQENKCSCSNQTPFFAEENKSIKLYQYVYSGIFRSEIRKRKKQLIIDQEFAILSKYFYASHNKYNLLSQRIIKYPKYKLSVYANFLQAEIEKYGQVESIYWRFDQGITFKVSPRAYGTKLCLRSNGKQMAFKFEAEEQLYHWVKHLSKVLKITDKHYSYHIFSKFEGLKNGCCSKYSRCEDSLGMKINNQMFIQDQKKIMRNQMKIIKEFFPLNNILPIDLAVKGNNIGFSFGQFYGKTLRQRLIQIKKEGKFNNYQRKGIIKGILQGLKTIHSKNIVHRDIQPENIKIIDYYSSFIVNFGFATKIDQKQPILRVCGTPGYIAPQILNNEKQQPLLDTKSDIFSAGAIFYEMLTGKPLFGQGYSRKSLVRQNMEFTRIRIDKSEGMFGPIFQYQIQVLEMMLVCSPKIRFTAQKILSHQYFWEDNAFDDHYYYPIHK